MTRKPTVKELGLDIEAQDWRRSGDRDGAIEIAFVPRSVVAGVGAAVASAVSPHAEGISAEGVSAEGVSAEGVSDADADETEWVLMRVAGDPEARILVFDRNEWECFLDGVRGGEFDDTLD